MFPNLSQIEIDSHLLTDHPPQQFCILRDTQLSVDRLFLRLDSVVRPAKGLSDFLITKPLAELFGNPPLGRG
jgi:hypothetical protein